MNMAEAFVNEESSSTVARLLHSGHLCVQLMGHGANEILPSFPEITLHTLGSLRAWKQQTHAIIHDATS